MAITTKEEIDRLRINAVQSAKGARIRALNDYARKNFMGARLTLTCGISALEPIKKAKVLQMVREFNTFDEGNDPYNEHDLGIFDFEGDTYMWQFSYYDRRMEYGSDDPSDEMKTCRVLTIMFAHER